MDMKLELVPMPVSDIDRAKKFYVDMVGFNEDLDVKPAQGIRIVQLTPAGSACSILLSTGLGALADMAPGTIKGLHLVVSDINHAREELISRGLDVGEIDGNAGGGVKYARLSDPEGSTLVLQEMAWRTGDAF
jgi:predicted enzyme related to lactoylglutathione lyase